MTTLFVLDYLMIDNPHSQEKEFEDRSSVYAWLLGQRESDFGYITLFHGENEPVDGWSDVIAFCRPKTPDVCPAVCTHGKGLNCPVCWPSKSSCIALRASELNINTIDHLTVNTLEPSDLNGIPMRVGDSIEFQPLPGIIRFHELEDGTEFWLAQTFAYGGRQKLQKTLEDGGPHNAVYVNDHHIGLIIPDDRLVIRA